jgi:hypothetical protein
VRQLRDLFDVGFCNGHGSVFTVWKSLLIL